MFFYTMYFNIVVFLVVPELCESIIRYVNNGKLHEFLRVQILMAIMYDMISFKVSVVFVGSSTNVYIFNGKINAKCMRNGIIHLRSNVYNFVRD